MDEMEEGGSGKALVKMNNAQNGMNGSMEIENVCGN
jgi:hypothetical protein